MGELGLALMGVQMFRFASRRSVQMREISAVQVFENHRANA